MEFSKRPLLINGFMATGKSTLARRVAERSGNPLVDLDARIVRRLGMSIEAYFQAHGEESFRSIEREELLSVIEGWRSEFARPPVCALGGGALLHRPTRLEVLRRAVVVTLEAPIETILERGSRQTGRPLFDGASAAAVAQRLEQRRQAYREANAVLDSAALDPDELARAALEVWQRNAVTMAAGDRTYAVEIGEGRLETCLMPLVEGASGHLLVSDETVHGLYGERVGRLLGGARCVVLPPGETAKTLSSIEKIYAHALDHGIDRKGLFLAVGGGVVTDMTGFAAATWLRGVRWVGVASTLLAMVDASVGGKTGVDFGPAKNSVGAFWQPGGVICETSMVATESERAYTGALAEVVKTAVIGDPQLFEMLDSQVDAVLRRDASVVTELVHRSVALKAWVVATDEREGGIRAWLNLGHTVGHALEAHGGYARLTHGEAVSLGLVAALRLGERVGVTRKDLTLQVVDLLKRLGLPCDLRGEPLREAADLIGLDKKRAGSQIKFVLARGVGDVTLVPLEVAEVKGHVPHLAS